MRTLILALALLFTFPLIAQEEAETTTTTTTTTLSDDHGAVNKKEIKTLFGTGKTHHGGFGALEFGYTEFDGISVGTAGIRGSWVIGHSFSFGVGAVGLIPDLTLQNKFEGQEVWVYGGYGGFWLEPTLFSRQAVHLTFPIMLGAGGIAYESADYILGNGAPINHEYRTTYDAFLVAEPGARVEVNVAKFFRISAGVSYRWTEDLQLDSTPSDAFTGWSGGLGLKFGSF